MVKIMLIGKDIVLLDKNESIDVEPYGFKAIGQSRNGTLYPLSMKFVRTLAKIGII